MNYPLEKYHFYIVNNEEGQPYKVIAVSTYAGKTVRGIAKCHPNDIEHFDLKYGKKLAAARCAMKIAEKRLNRAIEKNVEAANACNQAYLHLLDMQHYLNDSNVKYYKTLSELQELEDCI